MAELKENEINTIVYRKDGGEPQERKVVPLFVPRHTIKAIDVGDLTHDAALDIVEMFREYQQYYHNYVQQAMNFESFVEKTHGVRISPKWRSFKAANIVDVK